MTTRTTRSILAGALAASLLLAAPLAASGATPTLVAAAAYEGAEIPSTRAELTFTGAVVPNAPVYSEPASSSKTMTHVLPKVRATGEAEDRVTVSAPFTAHNEQWVAILVPETAYGTDTAKSTLAAPGVAYIRAGTVTLRETQEAVAQHIPSTKADLVTTIELTQGMSLYKQPVESYENDLKKFTNKQGDLLKSSPVFEHFGKSWVAVEAEVPGGIAYILADKRFAIVAPVKESAPTAAPATGEVQAGPAAPSAPTAQPGPTASAAPAVRLAEPEAESDTFGKILGHVAATIFAALVMAYTIFILKRRPVEAQKG